MDKERFNLACESVLAGVRDSGIGTLSEKSVHSVLKKYYEPQNCNHEVKIGSFIADAVGENGIVEVQTRGLFRLQKKLDVFLDYCPVTVVHPIIGERVIIRITEDGEVISRRKSPDKRSVFSAIPELYGIRHCLDNPRLTVIIPVLSAVDYRVLKRGTKKTYDKADIVPDSLLEELVLCCPDDYRAFIPDGISGEYTARSYAKAAGLHVDIARMSLYIFSLIGLAEKCGKDGRQTVFKIFPPK